MVQTRYQISEWRYKAILLLIWGLLQWHRAGAQAGETSTRSLESIRLTSATEFIERWYTCGPFPRSGSPELLDRWASSEAQAKLDIDSFHKELYSTKIGKQGWILRSIETVPMASADPITKKIRSLPTRIINFQESYPDQVIDSSAYALAVIDLPTSQTRTLLMGSDDGIRVWFNGQCIHSVQKERPIIPDEDFAIARFKPGCNILLVEVTNAKGYWGFMLRLHSSKSKAPAIMLPNMGDLIK